jgi:ABC-2 type transport system permease protein
MSTAATRTGTTAGTGPLLRFMLRRERRGLPWWLLGAVFMVTYQSVGSQSLYGTPEKLALLRETLGGNAAMVAMSGPKELLQTIGGEVIFEIFAYASIVVALMSMFIVGRNTRSDEETGRAELLRSARVGRHAPLAAALSLAGLASLALGVLIFAGTAGTGLPLAGSLLVGASLAGVGLTFAAVTAVAVQIFENPRSVYGAVGAAIGAAYVLRAAGDAGNGALSWLSPIGWGQRAFPYVDNRWWTLVLPVLATALLLVLATALLNRRDFGAGLRAPRPGPAYAPRTLGSALGLAWRLQRGSLVGWAVGLFLLGMAYGSLGDTMEQFIADNPEIAAFFPGGATNVVNSYLAFTMLFCALMAAAYAVASTLRARAEETAGRAEPILATRTGRWAWLASYLTIAVVGSTLVLVATGLGEGLAFGLTTSDPGQIPRLVGVALTYGPAVWTIVAVTALVFGWLPRATAIVGWATIGFCFLVIIFADLVDLPAWLVNLSPFTHTPQAPLESVAAAPLLALAGVAVLLVATGYTGFRRRDLG